MCSTERAVAVGKIVAHDVEDVSGKLYHRSESGARRMTMHVKIHDHSSISLVAAQLAFSMLQDVSLRKSADEIDSVACATIALVN